jgi:hypothetical protein
LRRAREQAGNEGVQTRRVVGRQWAVRTAHNLNSEKRQAFSPKGPTECAKLVRDDAERPRIRALVIRASADDFRCQIVRRTDARVCERLRGGEAPGHAKVADPQHRRLRSSSCGGRSGRGGSKRGSGVKRLRAADAHACLSFRVRAWSWACDSSCNCTASAQAGAYPGDAPRQTEAPWQLGLGRRCRRSLLLLLLMQLLLVLVLLLLERRQADN